VSFPGGVRPGNLLFFPGVRESSFHAAGTINPAFSAANTKSKSQLELTMPSIRPQDRAYLCRFSFADGRNCLTPRSPGHPHFCFYHARKEAQSFATDKLGRDLEYFFSGDYLSACDLSAALGRLLAAVARGHITPRSARTMAYLAQTLVQTIHLSQNEYINAFGTDAWRKAVRLSVTQNSTHSSPQPSASPSASQCSGRSSDRSPAPPAAPPPAPTQSVTRTEPIAEPASPPAAQPAAQPSANQRSRQSSDRSPNPLQPASNLTPQPQPAINLAPPSPSAEPPTVQPTPNPGLLETPLPHRRP